MKKGLSLLLFLVVSCSLAQAQVLHPLYADKDRSVKQQPQKAQQKKQALSLPFWDDFAEFDNRLNPDKWFLQGGAYVNNTYGNGHPTKNVVTFDGLKSNGRAYNISNYTTPGPTDTLTSKTIDLSSVTPADSLYLSFFYQGGGNGEAPGNNNQLILEFKRGNGSWQAPVDGIITGDGNTAFRQKVVYVPIGSSDGTALSNYHANFQFRFRAMGFQAGSADVWNIDYVYLNTGRNQADTSFTDVATTGQPTSYLAPYTAMPLHQYLTNPNAFKAKEVTQEITYLNKNIFRIVQYKAFITNKQTLAQKELKDSTQFFDPYTRHLTTVWDIADSVIDNTTDARELEFKYYVVSPSIDPEPLYSRYNDTITRTHVLSNYFAYDDGSAERAYNPVNATQIAVKFNAPLADTLHAIDFYFTPFKDDLLGYSVRLKVWAVGADGMPDLDNVLYEQSEAIAYSDLNTFRRIYLSAPLAVSGDFYVGWSQTFGAKHLLGFDVNSNSSQFRYYNIGGVWTQDPNQGSLMIRPVMEGSSLVNAPEQLALNSLRVYPNPGNGLYYFSENCEIIEIFDLNGRQISVSGRTNQHTLDLRGLPAGLYLARVKHQNQISTHKLMLQNN